jgi:uncharacterized protein (TIGR02271 family)
MSRKTTSSQEVKVPVVKEQLQVGKREVQEGTTRVQKRIVEQPVEKSVTLKDENVRVEQRAANRPVKDPDKAFKEQTIEMTETKEVPMVTKEARQTGEVALKKDVQQQRETIRDTVRSTDIDVIKGGDEHAALTDWARYEPDFRKNYQSTYANTGLQYEQVQPAYRYGYQLANEPQGRASDWSSIEPQAKTTWEQNPRRGVGSVPRRCPVWMGASSERPRMSPSPSSSQIGIAMMLVVLLPGCDRQADRRVDSTAAQEDASTMTTPKDTSPHHEASSRTEPGEAVVPIVEEELHIEKQKVETGRVRLTKTVQEREVLVTQPSMQEDIQIERVPVNRWLSEPASVRYEGDIMIIPVMEEVPVVEKRLRLKEELHVTKRQITTQRSEPVLLRTEEVRVERMPAQTPSVTSKSTDKARQ